MMHRISILIVLVMCISGLPAYPQAKPQTPPQAEQEPPSPLAVPKNFKYNPQGRRDPFVNPIPPAPPAPPEKVLPPRPPGLPGVLVNEAAITGVVVSRQDPSMTVVGLSAGVRPTLRASVTVSTMPS
jgi:hypothetical protein